MSSFSESKTESFINKENWKLIEYNKRQIGRIYPKGSRIDSSNYNPVPMWFHGCQIGRLCTIKHLIWLLFSIIL